MSQKYEKRVKLLMLGNSAVGKSSIILKFADNKFLTDYVVTLGVDYKYKVIQCNGKNTLVQIWDTAGQERFRTITPVYYRSVEGAIMAFSITDKESFDAIEYWIQNIDQTQKISDLEIILVGNKCDLESKRVISTEQAEALAKKYNFLYFETSAKTGDNIDKIFTHMAEKIIEKNEKNNNTKSEVSQKKEMNSEYDDVSQIGNKKLDNKKSDSGKKKKEGCC